MDREIITTLTELDLRNLIRDEISLIIPELKEILKGCILKKTKY